MNEQTQSAKGSGNPEPSQQDSNSDAGVTRGSNLLDAAGKKSAESAATDKDDSAEETKGATSTEETAPVKDPDTWSKTSALEEVKRLREENKASRLKYEQKVTELKSEMESRFSGQKNEMEELLKAKEELENLKAKDADKKRTLEEKLLHREKVLAELKEKQRMAEDSFQSRITEMEMKLKSYEAEAEAQMEVYKRRLDEERNSVPEKYRSVADLIIKGAGDSREALIALQEAKILGTFDEKSVHVVNDVPNAEKGARATKEKLDNAAKADRERMTSSQKIAAGLSAIRSGEKNTAFRTR